MTAVPQLTAAGLGEFVLLERARQGLTMQDVADRSHGAVSATTVCRVEKSRRPQQSLPHAEAILAALGYELVVRRVGD